MSSYIICATPRSGSTLLCDLLANTGIAGRPNSFFRRESFVEWADNFNISVNNWRNTYSFDESYLSAVLRQGASGTSVFGMRLMWESLGELSKSLDWFYPNLSSDNARFQSAFKSPVYIYLSRTDKVAQAVSRLKAEQSGLWHVFEDGTERERLGVGQIPTYDVNKLSMFVAEAENNDVAWKHWFAQQGIEPLYLTYEELAAEPQPILGTVLSFLGLDPAIANKAKVNTSKLANDESLEWAIRFRRETLKYK